ncbi:hypothetical protein TNCV_3156131 [Trichonephila clavipes]|nr:hypothetical protein TNCV_3156131 [Trichonephila clavipes]
MSDTSEQMEFSPTKFAQVAACEKLGDAVTGILALHKSLHEMDGRSPSPRNSYKDLYLSTTQAMIRRKEENCSLPSSNHHLHSPCLLHSHWTSSSEVTPSSSSPSFQNHEHQSSRYRFEGCCRSLDTSVQSQPRSQLIDDSTLGHRPVRLNCKRSPSTTTADDHVAYCLGNISSSIFPQWMVHLLSTALIRANLLEQTL